MESGDETKVRSEDPVVVRMPAVVGVASKCLGDGLGGLAMASVICLARC